VDDAGVGPELVGIVLRLFQPQVRATRATERAHRARPLAFAHDGPIALDAPRPGHLHVLLEPADVHAESPTAQLPTDRAIAEHERVRRVRIKSETNLPALTGSRDAHGRILPQPPRRHEPSPSGDVQLDVRLVERLAIPQLAGDLLVLLIERLAVVGVLAA